jgi:hypothetical protein
VEYKTLKTKDMGCTKCNGGYSTPLPKTPSGGCQCKSKELCATHLQVKAEDVVWASEASVEEFGINEGDTLESIVGKIARTYRTLQEEVNDKIEV